MKRIKTFQDWVDHIHEEEMKNRVDIKDIMGSGSIGRVTMIGIMLIFVVMMIHSG